MPNNLTSNAPAGLTTVSVSDAFGTLAGGQDAPLPSLDALTDPLRDFHWNDVVAVHILVVQPPVRGPHEILVLDVDEPLCPPDGRGVGPGDGVVHGAALLRRERGLVLELEPGMDNLDVTS